MNKEVIYLEPEDDITDILTKLQQAEQKLVALVPPKKATILRSAVNMKLVARVAKECEKVVVIVTADPAIVKMAMAAKIPVARTLQSRPVIPTEENVKAAKANEQVIDEDLEDNPKKSSRESKKSRDASESSAKRESDALELSEESLEKEADKAQAAKAKKKKAQAKNENASFMQKYRKLILVGIAALGVLIVALVWAFVFAPAVKITVAISSTPNNFSENIRFTTDEAAENLEENLLYVEEVSLDDTYKTDISATGEEDRGDKAQGRLTLTVQFTPKDYMGEGGYGISVAPGDTFSNNRNNLTYVATSTASKQWNGEDREVECDTGTISSNSEYRRPCTMSVTVSVEAAKAGEDYNVPANSSWARFEGVASVANGSPISGGTTNNVKVISNDDIEKVKEKQLSEHSEKGKEDLLEDLGEDLIPIPDSFKSEVTEVKTTPALGEEVKSDDKPTAEVKITSTIYALKKSTVEKYIEGKMSLAQDQKIYDFGDPYIERFSGIENEARLKTTVETGPTITEDDILEKSRGKKLGQAKSLLNSINGVRNVEITPSYFWVWEVPNDPSRITIDLTVEDKN